MKVIIIISLIFKSISTDTIFTKDGKSCKMEIAARVDCGYFSIHQEECENKGCCWGELETNSSYPWCFHGILIPTTILTNIPSSNLENIQTTILTTIPSTIIIAIPTTIITINPTTILTNIPTSISENIQTNILTTIPNKIIITIPTTIIATTPTTTLATNPIAILTNEVISSNASSLCEEKCLSCNEESKKLNLCILCNEAKNYYRVNYIQKNQTYFECLNKTSKILKKFYFNETNKEFRPCYETCETCEKEGDPVFHNCLTCDADHMFRPNGTYPKNNCIAKCKFYYISPYGQLKCLDTLECPSESKLLIKEKNKCTDDCTQDDTYKYQYNGNCLESCPENTINDNYLCKENINKCKLSEKEIELNDGSKSINTLAKSYSEEFFYTENHISNFKNNELNIIIYKNVNCIKELSLDLPIVDFGNCYSKVKDEYNLKEDLIIVVAEKLDQNNPSTSYSFFHPKTGEKLDAENICKDEIITVEENLLSFLNENQTNYNSILFLTEQNINIFNLTDEFYTNLCFEYESPFDKDIPLQDRIIAFYPNVTLCDEGCINSGIELENMKAKCDCKFNDIVNNDLIKENVLINSIVGEVFDIINNSNIAVLKCYKYIIKYFPKRYGGFITIILLFCHIILSIVFFSYELNIIRRYVYNLTENFLKFISQEENINKIEQPPKRTKSTSEKLNDINNKTEEKEKKDIIIKNKKDGKSKKVKKIKNKKEEMENKNMFKNKVSDKNNNSQLKIITKNSKMMEENSKIKSNSKDSLIISFNSKFNKFRLKTNNEKNKPSETKDNESLNNKNVIFFKNYLSPSVDDMEFDDAIVKDSRSFCEFFYETLKQKQTIANTFFAVDVLKTRSMKIIIFILNIILYLIVNGIFFSENYVSEVYHLEGKEGFFDFFPRSINRFFYTTIVSLIVGFIVDCFFFEEKKIKGIFIREKENELNLKGEIVALLGEIQRRYLIFITIVFIILIVGLYYILCFNYVYPHMQIEWIKSSIVIMIIMQTLSFLTCFLETVFRFISFYYKSERIFKISKLIN